MEAKKGEEGRPWFRGLRWARRRRRLWTAWTSWWRWPCRDWWTESWFGRGRRGRRSPRRSCQPDRTAGATPAGCRRWRCPCRSRDCHLPSSLLEAFRYSASTLLKKKTKTPGERVIRGREGGGSRSASSISNLGRNPPWKCWAPAEFLSFGLSCRRLHTDQKAEDLTGFLDFLN